MASLEEEQITCTGGKPKTWCPCVFYLHRIKDVLNGKGFSGNEDLPRYFYLDEGLTRFNSDDWKASDKDFIVWLSETYSLEGIERVCLLLQNCGCDRIADRPILFGNFVKTKSATKR